MAIGLIGVGLPGVTVLYLKGQHYTFVPYVGTAGGVIISFKMRALKDPGPGYETWVVTGAADFAGASAGGPIQAGTAVIADQWES